MRQERYILKKQLFNFEWNLEEMNIFFASQKSKRFQNRRGPQTHVQIRGGMIEYFTEISQRLKAVTHRCFQTDKTLPTNFKDKLPRFNPLTKKSSKSLTDIVPQQRAQLGKNLSPRDLCYGLSNEVTPNVIHR